MKRKKFKPGVRITIFFIIFAVLFFSLGIWQIERGQAKTQIMSEFENKLTKDPFYLNAESKKWDRVSVSGKWENKKQLLIDNVIHQGIAGYKVLTPLRIDETNKLILKSKKGNLMIVDMDQKFIDESTEKINISNAFTIEIMR